MRIRLRLLTREEVTETESEFAILVCRPHFLQGVCFAILEVEYGEDSAEGSSWRRLEVEV